DAATLALLAADDLRRVVVQHFAVGHHHVHVVAQGNSAAHAGRRAIDGRVVLDGAIGDGGESALVRVHEIESNQPAATALKRGAILKDHVGQREIGVATGAGIELHAAAIAVIAVRAVVHTVLKHNIRDAGGRIGKDGNVFVNRHHHVHTQAAGEGAPGDDGGWVAATIHRTDNIYRVVYVQGAGHGIVGRAGHAAARQRIRAGHQLNGV